MARCFQVTAGLPCPAPLRSSAALPLFFTCVGGPACADSNQVSTQKIPHFHFFDSPDPPIR